MEDLTIYLKGNIPFADMDLDAVTKQSVLHAAKPVTGSFFNMGLLDFERKQNILIMSCFEWDY